MGLFHELEGNVEAALAWIDAFSDEDGFLRYSERSSFGLYNQGWKDSFDSISHADGSLAKSPIALAEVQGYVLHGEKADGRAVRTGWASSDRAKKLRQEASRLFWKFNEKFWMPDENFYAQAHRRRRPVRGDLVQPGPGPVGRDRGAGEGSALVSQTVRGRHVHRLGHPHAVVEGDPVQPAWLP